MCIRDSTVNNKVFSPSLHILKKISAKLIKLFLKSLGDQEIFPQVGKNFLVYFSFGLENIFLFNFLRGIGGHRKEVSK